MKKDDDFSALGSIRLPDEFFREIHAAGALAGLLARATQSDPDTLARLAYAYADAMIECPMRKTGPP